MRRITIFIFAAIAALMAVSCGGGKIYYAKDFGIIPNTGEDVTQLVRQAIEQIRAERGDKAATLVFESGEYDFFPENANQKVYYISNHDQHNPKLVAVALEGAKNLTLKCTEGGQADFYMNGRMLPVAMVDCENCRLESIGIDTRVPQITQVEIVENDSENGYITYRIAPYVNYKIVDGNLVVYGRNWEHTPRYGIAFDGKKRNIIYRTSDIWVAAKDVEEIAPRLIRAPWRDQRLVKGSVIAMRPDVRPTPGIFLYGCKDTHIENTTVYYAEGMGLLAQICDNIYLDHFNVALRDGERYFTTQADATHFSACKGKIISKNGLYESMMDDAINVHGTYLRVTQRLDSHTLVGRYMHPQAYGFYWGGAGDKVQLINSDLMEIVAQNTIVEITPHDKEVLDGSKEFKIRFKEPLPEDVANGKYGIENLEWTPEVLFAGNTIRNNRARGTLFSTPKRTVVENNIFDHTSGAAILLCGDCNGWFETGACRDVVIRNNRFYNSLTNMFQFTDGIISIYPVIPDLKAQTKYFHGGEGRGVVIENNIFETFDNPLVYAKSLDGLVFRGNKEIKNNDFEPFHWNKHRFLFDKVTNVVISENEWDGEFSMEKDVVYRQ